MHSKQKFLPRIPAPKYIVFSDFDETYLSHSNNGAYRSSRIELENYLVENCSKHNIMFGWVTGSSLASVFLKIDKYELRVMPHFISSNLGTEIVYFNQEEFGRKDEAWEKMISKSNFSDELVTNTVDFLLYKHDINLIPQLQQNNLLFLKSYYYYERNEELDTYTLSKIKELAESRKIGLNISRCNPLAGDPENCFDVDFIPLKTGKKSIVDFLLAQMHVTHENSIAFGDSGNDVEMLKAVKHGYLVGNATNEAKVKHKQVEESNYTKGILSVLQKIIK